MIQFEVNKSEQGNIEFSESTDDFVIDIEGQALIKLVRCNPSNLLTHNLNLEVGALDAEEGLRKALSDGAVCHPLGVQLLAHKDVLVGDLESLMLWEVGEKRNEAESVIQVT